MDDSTGKPRITTGPIGGLPARGFTLIELLVTLCLMCCVVALGAVPLGRGLDCLRARGVCQAWQTSAAQAQLQTLWSGAPTALHVSSEGLTLTQVSESPGTPPPGTDLQEMAVATAANVSKWRESGGVVVVFAGPFAAPNAAGSVTFGEPGWGSKAVVRLESGLTRRDRP